MTTPTFQQYTPPQPHSMDALRLRIDDIERKSGARSLAVAVYDTQTHASFRRNAERWFHAASTIKVAILVGVYASIHHGWLLPQSRVHVRNRFFGAVDGTPFRVLADRDANSEVHAAIGKMMRVSELALHMIATSSNLATNLLLDLVGLDTVQRSLDELSVDGIDIRRGVEDERAFDLGINNRVTADGLTQLLRLVAEEDSATTEAVPRWPRSARSPQSSRARCSRFYTLRSSRTEFRLACRVQFASRTKPGISRRWRTTRASSIRRDESRM